MTTAGTLHSRSLPSRILEVLEADGGWFTVDALTADLARFTPAPQRSAVYRAVHRLVDREMLDRRQVAVQIPVESSGRRSYGLSLGYRDAYRWEYRQALNNWRLS